MWACEKREPLDVGFPSEKGLFCEVIGIPSVGFFGHISRISETSPAVYAPISVEDECQLNIYENDVLVYDEMVLYGSNIGIPYAIDTAATYRLTCDCKDYQLRSKAPKEVPPPLEINNSSAYRFFVDSLNTYVVDVNYSIQNNGTSDQLFYYAYSERLSFSSNNPFFESLGSATFGVPTLSSTIGRYKRIPSSGFSESYAIVTAISVDKDLFQYSRNIQQLGQIPNDDIANHHGNLEGGVGYFGVVQIREKVLPL